MPEPSTPDSTALAIRKTTQPATTPRIGLALGGGGARGLAHVLMLEAIDELGVKPQLIAGCSIGAIFGAAYASGMSAREIRAQLEDVLGARVDLVRQLFAARAEPISRLLNILPVRGALLKPEALLELIMPSALPADMSSMHIPLRIVATDFYAQDAAVFTHGPTIPAIAASMALPAIFSPVMIDGRAYMDGGLVNPLPFDILDDVEITVAIDVIGSHKGDASKPPSAFSALVGSSQIFQASILREKLRARQPDILIDACVDDYAVLDFHKFSAILETAAPAKEKFKRALATAIEEAGKAA